MSFVGVGQMIEQYAAGGIAAIMLAVLGWVARTTLTTQRSVDRMGVTLHGEDGTNGMRSEMARLRETTHDLRDDVQGLTLQHALLRQDVDRLLDDDNHPPRQAKERRVS